MLFQFDRPVSVIEELFPATIAPVAEVKMNEWIVLWLYRWFYKRHSRLFWRLAAFFDIAFQLGENYVSPDCFSAYTARYYVIE